MLSTLFPSVPPADTGAAALMRAFDWSATPLGPPAHWPQPLKTLVELMLAGNQPMFTAWGPERTMLYNDAYAALMGGKHPGGLGKPLLDVWAEIASDLQPLLDSIAAGEPVHMDDITLFVDREGYGPQEAHFAFSYTPVREEGGAIAGMFCACVETTEQVKTERERRSTLAALSASEENYRYAVDLSPQTVWTAGPDGLLDHVGTRWHEWTGSSGLGTSWGDVLHPDDLGPSVEAWTRSVTTGAPYDIEHRARMRDGGYRWMYSRAFPRRDDNGAIVRWHGTTEDIDDVRRAEEARRETEARLGLIVDNATDYAIFTTDRERRVTSWSAGAAAVFGWSAAEMIGELADVIFTPEDRADGVPEREVGQALETGCATDERWHLRKDGRRVFMDGSARRLPGAGLSDGSAVMKIARDDTERRRTQDAIAESEARFRNMADGAPVMMWVTDASGYCTYLNKRWYEYTGQSPDEAEGFGWLDATHPDDKAMADEAFRNANAAQGPFRIEYRLRRADGIYRWAIDAASPRFDAEGGYLGYVGSVIDIDERREFEAALQRNESRLRSALDVAALGMFDWWPETGVVEADARTRAMFGLPADGAVQADEMFSRMAPEDLPRVHAAAMDAVEHARRLELDYDVLLPDGTRRTVASIAEPAERADGRARRMSGTFVDMTARREAEAALRASEEFNRRVLASSADCIKVLDLDGRLEFMSEGGMCVMEVDAFGAIQGACWPDFWTGEDHRKALAAIETAKRGGTGRFQGFAPTLKGSPRWWDVSVTAIDGAGGAPEKLLSVSRDITEQRRAEERLRELNETLEAEVTERTAERDRMWEMSPDLMLVIDFDGVFRRVNPAWTASLGYSAEELVGRHIHEFVEAVDHAALTDAFQAAADGRRLTVENRYRHKDGSTRWISWVAAPAKDVIYATGRDVTNQRAQAMALAERTAERDRMWESSPDLMLVIDFAGVFRRVNPAWTHVLGYGSDELVGHHVNDFVIPDDHDATTIAYEEAARGGQPVVENRYRHKDGSVRWISWVAARTGNMTYALGRDVTDEREQAAELAAAQDALRQAQKMEAVGQLTGGIAHDFNNLLTGIVGSLELLQRRVAEGRYDTLEKYAGVAMTSAQRAAALTQRLLAFSRRQPLSPKTVEANRLVASMEDLLRRTLGPQIDLEMVLAGGLWPTLCDPNQLESAILNLAINARDAMAGGGRLTVETANAYLDEAYARGSAGEVEAGQYVAVCVTDTGTGIPPDVMARVFEPFFTTKPLGQGTGLGLSQLYGFVKQSGGHVAVYSEPGEGTTFKLYLPRHGGRLDVSEAEGRGAEPARASDGQCVLVVEDEAAVRMLIAETLDELGYTAVEAVDGPGGLRELQSERRIDLLVTDVGLPGLNGRQLADAARELRPDLKVLFITGFAGNAAVGNGLLDPGMEMMTKPFAMDALAAKISGMIEG